MAVWTLIPLATEKSCSLPPITATSGSSAADFAKVKVVLAARASSREASRHVSATPPSTVAKP
jgi:hypothetical protein